MRHLIVILSEQPFTNILFVKEYYRKGDKISIISTPEMEKNNMSSCFLKALSIDDIEPKIVNAFDTLDILDKLSTINIHRDDQFYLNITGGTKLMSIIINSYFQKFPNCYVFYYPINSSYKWITYPTIEKSDIECNLSLIEYLYAYGYLEVKMVNRNQKLTYEHSPSDIYRLIIQKEGIENIKKINQKRHINYKEMDKNYYSGDWFEFYIYDVIKSSLDLNTENIASLEHLKKGKQDKGQNIDLIFVYQKSVFVIEAKVFSGIVKAEKYQPVFHKLNSISNNLDKNIVKIALILAKKPNDVQSQSRIKELEKENKVKSFFINDMGENLINVVNFIKKIAK